MHAAVFGIGKVAEGRGVYREDILCSQVDVLQHDRYLRVVE